MKENAVHARVQRAARRVKGRRRGDGRSLWSRRAEGVFPGRPHGRARYSAQSGGICIQMPQAKWYRGTAVSSLLCRDGAA